MGLYMQGYHSGSFLVSLLGIFKAVVGILIRPTVGICEFGGKSAYGIGLLFLGREGISGTIQKRVRAPGTLTDDSEEVSRLQLKTPSQAMSLCTSVLLVNEHSGVSMWCCVPA